MNDSTNFEPIRKLDRLRPLFNVGIGFSIIAYKTVFKKYRPQEIENFSRKFARELQDAFFRSKNLL